MEETSIEGQSQSWGISTYKEEMVCSAKMCKQLVEPVLIQGLLLSWIFKIQQAALKMGF